MDQQTLRQSWKAALHADPPEVSQFETLAADVVALYCSGDERFREHLSYRWKRLAEKMGIGVELANFDLAMAKAFIADEIGFADWDELKNFAVDPKEGGMLFRYALAAMERGDFTALEEAIGAQEFYSRMVVWKQSGLFDENQETLDEILSAACMLGQTETARYLLAQGVDPYAGMRTWLAGPHYAVSSGCLETVKMLLDAKIPLEVENKYGGTMLGQALWSAINEHAGDHAEIIELLIDAGARVPAGTFEWWEEQDVPSPETKGRVRAALEKVQGRIS